MIRKFFFESLMVFFAKAFGAFAGLLLTIFITNISSSDDAGYFFIVLGVINVLGCILCIGAPNVLIKIVGAKFVSMSYKVNNDFSAILKLSFFLCLTSFVFIFIFGDSIFSFFFNVTFPLGVFKYLGAGVAGFVFVQLFSSALFGCSKPLIATFVQNISVPIGFILSLYFYELFDHEVTITFLVVGYCAFQLATASLGAFFWFKNALSKFIVNAAISKELKFSLIQIWVVTLMTLSVEWAGQFAILSFEGVSDVAYYTAAQRAAMLVSFILVAVNLVVAPKFANAYEHGRLDELNSVSLLSSRLAVFLVLPILLFIFLVPDVLMRLFGDEYVIAAPLLKVISIGQFINVVTGSVGYLLTMTNHEKDYRNVVLFSGPLAIVLAFSLTREYGIIGAAYATAISMATQNLLAVWMVKKRLGFNALNIFRTISN